MTARREQNAAPRSKKTDREQIDFKLDGDKQKPTGPERTLEVDCSNCVAKFVAYYGLVATIAPMAASQAWFCVPIRLGAPVMGLSGIR